MKLELWNQTPQGLSSITSKKYVVYVRPNSTWYENGLALIESTVDNYSIDLMTTLQDRSKLLWVDWDVEFF
jgi:hypothetical protein